MHCGKLSLTLRDASKCHEEQVQPANKGALLWSPVMLLRKGQTAKSF